MTIDERYMLRALELAELGEGYAHPNPMVGAVIVHEGKIIGEGYHHKWGEPHAEVMAIHSVREQELLKDATIYVTLEPCSHYGKTPPCAQLLLDNHIPRVVIAMMDPYHEVAGRGIRMLREAGVEVVVGVLEEQARGLNAHFVVQHTERRPFISLKWAQSSDGYMDHYRSDASVGPVVFSSPIRQREVHHSRARHEAILVGYRTALLDDPSLNNRYWWGKHPIRIVIDPHLALPHTLKVFDTSEQETWILYLPDQVKDATSKDLRDMSFEEDHGLSHCPACSASREQMGLRLIPLEGAPSLSESVCRTLSRENIQSVLIEGGGRTLADFIEQELFDHIEVETSPMLLGSGVSAPKRPFRLKTMEDKSTSHEDQAPKN